MGVLLISSGLIIGLLHEARAITVEFSSPSTSIQDATVYTVDITIPDGSRVPINSIAAIIEKDRAGFTDKSGAVLVTRAECSMGDPQYGICPDNGAFTTQGGTVTNGITKIKFLQAYKISVTSGYELSDATTYYGYGAFSGDTTGYGYDDISDAFSEGFGYGYGYTLGTGQTSFSDPTGGYGYGYDGADLILRFEITVSPGNIGSGTFYLTVLADTDSSIIGDLSSKFHEFTSSPGGGGGGGGGATVTTFDAGSITPPVGALRAWQATISGASGATITINFPGDANYPSLTLTLGEALTNVVLTFVVWPDTTPAPGTSAVASGFDVFHYLQITIAGSTGEKHQLTLQVKYPQADVSNANQAAFLHFLSQWMGQSRITLTLANSVYSGPASSPCCSVFAVGLDTQNPTVTLTVPTGAVSGTTKITAAASDNLQVAKVVFSVDGVEKFTDTTAPYELDLDTRTLSNAAHTIKAVAHDFVDNKGEDSEQITTQNVPGPVVTTTAPPTFAEKAKSFLLWLVVAAIAVVVIAALVMMAQGKWPKKKGPKPPGPKK